MISRGGSGSSAPARCARRPGGSASGWGGMLPQPVRRARPPRTVCPAGRQRGHRRCRISTSVLDRIPENRELVVGGVRAAIPAPGAEQNSPARPGHLRQTSALPRESPAPRCRPDDDASRGAVQSGAGVLPSAGAAVWRQAAPPCRVSPGGTIARPRPFCKVRRRLCHADWTRQSRAPSRSPQTKPNAVPVCSVAAVGSDKPHRSTVRRRVNNKHRTG